jgi:hypothetical protein
MKEVDLRDDRNEGSVNPDRLISQQVANTCESALGLVRGYFRPRGAPWTCARVRRGAGRRELWVKRGRDYAATGQSKSSNKPFTQE